MGFNSDKFTGTKYKDRTCDVPVPELKAFFDDGEEPVWTVKGLTASEIAKANDEVANNYDLLTIVSSLASTLASDKSEAIKELVGVSEGKTPNDIVKRISQLMSGSVSPTCTREMAVKLGENFSITFFKLSNKILELSGQGRLGE